MQQEDVFLVRFARPAEVENVPAMKRHLWPALEGSGPVLLEIGPVRLDPRRLGVILSLQRYLELQGRVLLVVSTAPEFFTLLERSGAGNALTLFEDAEQAAAYARQHVTQAMAA